MTSSISFKTSLIVAAVAAATIPAACSEETEDSTASTSPSATTTNTTGTNGTSTGGTNQGGAGTGGDTGGTSAGGTSAGGSGEGGALIGCIENPNLCPPDWQCCGGVPYDPAGECHLECNMRSDRASKHDFEPIDVDTVLERLATVPISRWRYDAEPGVDHMGPMAQDFHATFGLGDSDRRITTVDANGVALAAIQALHHRLERLEAQSNVAEKRNEHLRTELASLQSQLQVCVKTLGAP
jgi:hypothetical protein